MEPREEHPLFKLDRVQLVLVWYQVTTELMSLGRHAEIQYTSWRILQHQRDNPKITDKQAREWWVYTIENLMAVVDEHRPLNPEMDPER